MSSADLMGEGLNLMLFGMGFVFLFLTLLVFVTSLMSRIVQTTMPVSDESQVTGGSVSAIPNPGAADPASDPVLLAVLSDAIQQHRARSQ